jgi:hypothetical protein
VDVAKAYFLKDTATAKEIVEQINRGLEDGRARLIAQKSEFNASGPPSCQMVPVDGASAAAPETSPGRAIEFVEIKAPAGNVRAAASTDSKILATLPRGTKLEKVADASGWVKVRLSNGTEGFIIPRLVQEVKVLPPPAPRTPSVPAPSIHLAADPPGTR